MLTIPRLVLYFMGLFSCCQNVRHISAFFLELLESMNSSGSSSLPTETEKKIVKQGNIKVQLTFTKIHFYPFLRFTLLYHFSQKQQVQHKSQ